MSLHELEPYEIKPEVCNFIDMNGDKVPELFVGYPNISGDSNYTLKIYFYNNGHYTEGTNCYLFEYTQLDVENRLMDSYLYGGGIGRFIYEVTANNTVVLKDHVATIGYPANYYQNDTLISKERYDELNRQYDAYSWQPIPLKPIPDDMKPTESETRDYIGEGTVITEKDPLNLRSEPSTTGKIIHQIPKGTKVKIYGTTVNWYKVKYDGMTGYVSMEFIDAKFYDDVVINKVNKLGTIDASRGEVSGFNTDYIVNGGAYSVVRKSLKHGWHVQAMYSCVSRGLTWYELWDSQDGDYYGWVDESFISFDTDQTTQTVNGVEVHTCNKSGKLNTHGGTLPTTSLNYITGGSWETLRDSLPNSMSIKAKRCCTTMGIIWYEIYDSTGTECYGWVDGTFIDFD